MPDAQLDVSKLDEMIGKELGVSDWVTIDQKMIDDFSKATRDPDPMHIDPDWCAENSPFETTIAFGFMTMSLLTHMFHNVMGYRSNTDNDSPNYGLNYGFDRMRLVAPIPVGSRIRGRFSLGDLRERSPGEKIQSIDVVVEIEGKEKPALVGRWLSMIVDDEGHERISHASAG